MMIRWICLISFVVAVLYGAPASTTVLKYEEPFADTVLERRAVAVFRQVRCVVCEGESVYGSNTKLAGDMRAVIRKRIVDGESDAAILDYMVMRYGEQVLMRPVFASHTYLLWLLPVGLLVAGAGMYIVNRRC